MEEEKKKEEEEIVVEDEGVMPWLATCVGNLLLQLGTYQKNKENTKKFLEEKSIFHWMIIQRENMYLYNRGVTNFPSNNNRLID